jgi:flagellar biosynthetic protein FlhB
MADGGQNKTEKATPKKRNKAKRKGDVVDSKDLSAAFALGGASFMLFLFGARISDGLRLALTDHLGGLAHAPRVATGAAAVATIQAAISRAAFVVAPFLGVIAAFGVAAQVTMHGLVWSPEKLKFELNKLNPITGFGKVFNLKGLVKAGFGLLKLAAIAVVVILTVRSRWEDILAVGRLSVVAEIGLLVDILLHVLLRVALAVLVLGIADFSFQKWKKEKELKMTKEEVKEERKQSEGDPKVKAKIRSKMRERARQRMMADVDTATVVVTNPTHFAVALKYDRGVAPAPKVVAKGLEHLALKIRERAEAAGVPIVEEPPLARSLFRHVEVGDFVPPDLYRAVAAILSYVYRMRGARR